MKNDSSFISICRSLPAVIFETQKQDCENQKIDFFNVLANLSNEVFVKKQENVFFNIIVCKTHYIPSSL